MNRSPGLRIVRLRKLILKLHLVLGLGIGVLLASAGLTGSVLVWRQEIDMLLHPGLLRVEPGPIRAPLQHLLQTVESTYPGTPIIQLRMPKSPEAVIQVVGGGTEPLQIMVDPYRGAILGARGETETFANALFHWHTSLLAGEAGEKVTGMAALLLIVLVASGVIVWWPGLRRLGQAVQVNWRANWKRVNFDLHRAAGFWTSLYLVVVAITGSSLIFHDAYMVGLNWVTRSPARPAPPPVTPLAGLASLPLDTLVELANEALPGGAVTVVSLPQRSTAPLVVRKKLEAELHPNGRNFVYLHPQTGEVLALENALTAPVGTRAYNNLYPIHIGRWGGLMSRVLSSLLGLVPLLLLVSGFLMWQNRSRGGRRRAAVAGIGRRSTRTASAA
jgi:uncharacterized iron-regulated membrane protein